MHNFTLIRLYVIGLSEKSHLWILCKYELADLQSPQYPMVSHADGVRNLVSPSLLSVAGAMR